MQSNETHHELPVLRHACCGDCYENDIECIEPGLALIVLAAVKEHCTHARRNGHACQACGPALLHLAELVRDSRWWPLHEGGFAGDIRWAEDTFGAVGVGRPPVHGLSRRYDSNAWPLDYLTTQLIPFLHPTLAETHRVIAFAQDQCQIRHDALIREPGSPHPTRAGANRGELEIANRLGWAQPQRWEIEARTRSAAAAALNEAHFVALSLAAGVELIPKLGGAHSGVAGYSAYLADIHPQHRREYAGQSLARDLSLPALRRVWNRSEPSDGRQAWFTWLTLCPDPLPGYSPPGERPDRRWRWLLPRVAATRPLPPVPDLPSAPTSRQVRDYLIARQGDVCAMCQIQRHGWETTRGTPVPPELLGPALHLDHDHETGLVRGLLCIGCNTLREPVGKRALSDVWLAYTSDPPIGPHAIPWRAWRT